MANSSNSPPESPPPHLTSEGNGQISPLFPNEIVHMALSALTKITPLIAWGALLDHFMGVPRIQKNFQFLVPDDKLATLSAVLLGLNLPIAELSDHVVRNEGDFLRLGRLHCITPYTDPYRIQCLHLIPASLPDYRPVELITTRLYVSTVEIHIPRPSAVYAGIIRMMLKYPKFCAERYKLQSDLELLCSHDLLGLKLGEDDEAPYVDKRCEDAVERIRAWGTAGEWREGEEWVEDALIGIVEGEKDMVDLPSRDTDASGETILARAPSARVYDHSANVVSDRLGEVVGSHQPAAHGASANRVPQSSFRVFVFFLCAKGKI
ncbi:uncharacterized protein SCHCODRAFT_02688773 [Schizophyllum commune H4-8]|uniref:Uncharacterized protein n=1 Tax=Schizophyllum commune (strain H4-8 / FGSC 9210) TaxID=578458 RepID=D8Q4Z6_SCHCM|nr:uncharacterized protein SCHCODRAFT_02688773 [Schizophyllum commune H4-8]KAI5892401.1 hypothetical protein SCHCODRAFT_02688773 [Schizophyllum commune H4-8]